MNLSFGLGDAVPAAVSTAWGARLIFPDDLLPDRQDVNGDDVAPLIAWLNDGALPKALSHARKLADAGKIRNSDSAGFTLYRDRRGVIVANAHASYGYLYVAAWLHEEEPTKQPAPEYGEIA